MPQTRINWATGTVHYRLFDKFLHKSFAIISCDYFPVFLRVNPHTRRNIIPSKYILNHAFNITFGQVPSTRLCWKIYNPDQKSLAHLVKIAKASTLFLIAIYIFAHFMHNFMFTFPLRPYPHSMLRYTLKVQHTTHNNECRGLLLLLL
jgi:hypothetical protein